MSGQTVRHAASPVGLRERKKQMTRLAVLDAAERLFTARGYDNVTVAEIADAADISVKTLFTYFASKEDLAFAGEGELRDQLVTAVRARGRGESVIDAVCGALRRHAAETAGSGGNADDVAAFRRGFGESQALQNRMRRMWAEYEDALTDAIIATSDVEPDIARLQAMQAIVLARSVPTAEVAEAIAAAADPRQAVFDWLDRAAQFLDGHPEFSTATPSRKVPDGLSSLTMKRN
jgi:AcrR family transcriptional regulator